MEGRSRAIGTIVVGLGAMALLALQVLWCKRMSDESARLTQQLADLSVLVERRPSPASSNCAEVWASTTRALAERIDRVTGTRARADGDDAPASLPSPPAQQPPDDDVRASIMLANEMLDEVEYDGEWSRDTRETFFELVTELPQQDAASALQRAAALANRGVIPHAMVVP